MKQYRTKDDRNRRKYSRTSSQVHFHQSFLSSQDFLRSSMFRSLKLPKTFFQLQALLLNEKVTESSQNSVLYAKILKIHFEYFKQDTIDFKIQLGVSLGSCKVNEIKHLLH